MQNRRWLAAALNCPRCLLGLHGWQNDDVDANALPRAARPTASKGFEHRYMTIDCFAAASFNAGVSATTIGEAVVRGYYQMDAAFNMQHAGNEFTSRMPETRIKFCIG